MKAKVKDKIRIIRKMNDWSMEYQEGDVFTVESTWYGGVNVTSKTGVPLSLDEIEYEVIAAEGAEDSAQSPQIHLLFHADTRQGLERCLAGAEALLLQCQKEGMQGKFEILAEYEALLCLKNGTEAEERIEKLAKEGVKIYADLQSARESFLNQEELSGCVRTVPLGAALLAKKQMEGYGYVKY